MFNNELPLCIGRESVGCWLGRSINIKQLRELQLSSKWISSQFETIQHFGPSKSTSQSVDMLELSMFRVSILIVFNREISMRQNLERTFQICFYIKLMWKI